MANGFEKIINESFSKYFEKQNIELSKRTFYESLNKDSFKSDIYNALADVCFQYHLEGNDPTEEEVEQALEWFTTHFFEFGYDEEE